MATPGGVCEPRSRPDGRRDLDSHQCLRHRQPQRWAVSRSTAANWTRTCGGTDVRSIAQIWPHCGHESVITVVLLTTMLLAGYWQAGQEVGVVFGMAAAPDNRPKGGCKAQREGWYKRHFTDCDTYLRARQVPNVSPPSCSGVSTPSRFSRRNERDEVGHSAENRRGRNHALSRG